SVWRRCPQENPTPTGRNGVSGGTCRRCLPPARWWRMMCQVRHSAHRAVPAGAGFLPRHASCGSRAAMATTTASQLLIARRYLDRGFTDTAMEIFVRTSSETPASDWECLAEALFKRQCVAAVVRVCEIGGIPLPRERMLALGDARLHGRDLDGA